MKMQVWRDKEIGLESGEVEGGCDERTREMAYEAYVTRRMNQSMNHENYDTVTGVYERTSANSPYSSAERYSAFNYTDEDDDFQSLYRCPRCDFEIDVSALRSSLEEAHSYNPKDVVCPVCDEKFGEDAIKHIQRSRSLKRNWRSERSHAWDRNSPMSEKKLAAWENRREPMPEPILSPLISSTSDEDSINNALDISNAKSPAADAADVADEVDVELRRLRASFVQELVVSTILK